VGEDFGAEPEAWPEARPETQPEARPETRPEARPVAPTGEPRVDEALRRLDELGDLPVSEHPQIFERVHSQLVEVLGELRSPQAS
jgi:hypothetical protein